MTDRDLRFDRMKRYEPRRQPYVQVTDYERGRYHARVIGWIPGQVFIEYPKLIRDYTNTGQRYFKWVPTENAVRIRRSDSIWLSVEDDDDWHEHEDAKITFRPDPWTIYTQDDTGPVSD